MKWSGLIYDSGTIVASGDSGYLNVRDDLIGIGGAAETLNEASAFDRVSLLFVPAGLATDETLDLDWNVAWTAAGVGDIKAHDFTQVTNTNAVERVIAPGGESSGMFLAEPAVGSFLPGLVPPFWKFLWTLGGTTKSMSFSVYAFLSW